MFIFVHVWVNGLTEISILKRKWKKSNNNFHYVSLANIQDIGVSLMRNAAGSACFMINIGLFLDIL